MLFLFPEMYSFWEDMMLEIASKNTKTLGLSTLFDKLDFPISLLIPNLISYSEHYFRNLLPKRNLKLLLDLNLKKIYIQISKSYHVFLKKIYFCNC